MEALSSEHQLTEIREELDQCTAQVITMRKSLSADDWQRKPGPESWSAIECVEHINATNRATLDRISEGLSALEGKPKHHGPYHLDLFGWLLVKSLTSRSRLTKSKTAAPFVPKLGLDISAVLDEFIRRQSELMSLLDRSAGVPLDAHKMQSVFEARIKYNLYSAFKIVAVHTTRHLDQADRAVKTK